MNRTRTAVLLVLTIVASAAACDIRSAGSGSPFGLGTFTAQGAPGAYEIDPSIAFLNVSGAALANSAVTRDTCIVTGYSSQTPPLTTFAQPVSAGPYVVVSTATATDTLTRTNYLDPFYRSPGTLPFTPGDSLTIKIAGDPNGFPASTFRAGTAEAFTVGALTTVPDGDDLPVTWSASTVPGSAMLMSFRYPSADTTELNTQVACTFVDDGTAAVPARILADWNVATYRTAEAERVRTLIGRLDSPRAYLNLLSVFVVPMPTP